MRIGNAGARQIGQPLRRYGVSVSITTVWIGTWARCAINVRPGRKGFRVVARQHDDFNPRWLADDVEAQQLFHQRKRHAGLGGQVEPLLLQGHVGVVVTGLEALVFLFEIEQRAGGDGDDELAVKGGWHGVEFPFRSGGAAGIGRALLLVSFRAP